MNNEAGLWQKFSALVGPLAHLTRIESHATSIGQPDVNYCIDGIEGNVELKYTNSSKKGIILRPSQHQWFRKRVKAGGRPWVLVWVNLPLQQPYYIVLTGESVVEHKLVQEKSIAMWKEIGTVMTKLDVDIIAKMMIKGECSE